MQIRGVITVHWIYMSIQHFRGWGLVAYKPKRTAVQQPINVDIRTIWTWNYAVALHSCFGTRYPLNPVFGPFSIQYYYFYWHARSGIRRPWTSSRLCFDYDCYDSYLHCYQNNLCFNNFSLCFPLQSTPQPPSVITKYTTSILWWKPMADDQQSNTKA